MCVVLQSAAGVADKCIELPRDTGHHERRDSGLCGLRKQSHDRQSSTWQIDFQIFILKRFRL